MTRAARRYVLAGALLLGGTCVAAGTPGADFVLSKTGNVRSVASGGRVWQGHVDSDPGAVPPPGASTHHLAFDFESDDYFRRDNRGHFAVGLRGDARSDANGDGAPDLRGGGVVLGNVTEYPRHGDCGPTKRPSTIAIESFWAGGNCIHPLSEGPELRNGTRYRVAVSYRVAAGATPARRITYTLSQRTAGGWTRIATRSVDDRINPSPPDLGGWFLVEVFSTHDWTFRVYNLRQWWS